MNSNKMILFVISMCVCISVTFTDVRADEIVEIQDYNEVEVTDEPYGNDGSVGIMEDDIVVEEKEVVDDNKALAPAPEVSNNKTDGLVVSEKESAMDEAPKTGDNYSYFYLISAIITLVGIIYVCSKKKLY